MNTESIEDYIKYPEAKHESVGKIDIVFYFIGEIMTIKEYENILKQNNIKVSDFNIIQSYYIKTNLGVIHLDKDGNITSVTGKEDNRVNLCKILKYPSEKVKKRWETKIQKLEQRINYLESLLKLNEENNQ